MMIVNALVKIQKQRKLNDSQMAESLGVHRVSWCRNKRTGVISAEVLLRAFEVYPELLNEFTTPVQDVAHHVRPSNGKEGRYRGWLRGLLARVKSTQL